MMLLLSFDGVAVVVSEQRVTRPNDVLLLCFCSATNVARAKTAGHVFVNVDQVDVDVLLKRGL